MKNTMPRTSVSNEFKVGVQTGKPPLKSHWDKRYFGSALLRSWREGNPHSKWFWQVKVQMLYWTLGTIKRWRLAQKASPNPTHMKLETPNALKLKCYTASRCRSLLITKDYSISGPECALRWSVNMEQKCKTRKRPGRPEASPGRQDSTSVS